MFGFHVKRKCLKKAVTILAVIFSLTFLFPFSSALPTPTIISEWKVTHTTDTGYFTWFGSQSQPNTYACLLSKTATKINELPAHKQSYIKDEKGNWIPYVDLNVQKLGTTVSNLDRDYFGWCRNIDSNVITSIKLGENSTIWEYQTLFLYDTPTYDKDGFIIEVSQDGNTTLDIDWVEINGTGIFYPDGVTLPIDTIYFKQNQLNKLIDCEYSNQYFSTCTYQEIGYQEFENKNNITNKTIIPVYEYIDPSIWQQFVIFFRNIFGYEPEEPIPELKYYLIKYEGNIIDLDPSLIYTYTTSTYGFYTNTTATANGIRLIGTNTTGNFTSFVFYNNSMNLNWTVTLGHNATGTTNISLQTRTATSYNTSDANLVALWGLNGNALDEKGILNGTSQGTVNYNNGNGSVGQGVFLVNTDTAQASNYINTAVTGLPTGNSARTIVAWVKTSSNGYNNPFFKYGTVANYQGWSADLNSNKFRLCIYAECAGTSTTTVATNTWYHIAFVYHGNKTIDYYLNGKIDGSATLTNTPNTGTAGATIGGSHLATTYWSGSSGWNGAIDELKVYNDSLSSSEVQNLYELGSYHIQWGSWQDKGITTSGVIYNSTQDKFLQFKSLFNGNNQSFLFNHTIGYLEPPLVLPTVDITYPVDGSSITIIPDEINYTYTQGTYPLSKCWYSLDSGYNNSTIVDAGINFTSVPFVEGEQNAWVWCNDTLGNENFDLISFFSNLPPIINVYSPTQGSVQDLVFKINFSATDTDGIDTYLWSLDNKPNVSYTTPIDYYASAGSHSIVFFVNDTYGAMNYTSVSFTTKNETDPYWTGNWTNFNECPEGTEMYGIYENGSVKCRPYSGTTTTICPEDVFGYYNPKLPSIKKYGCVA
jgi:hypothetical protein